MDSMLANMLSLQNQENLDDITDNEVALINKKSLRINNEINRKRMIKSYQESLQ